MSCTPEGPFIRAELDQASLNDVQLHLFDELNSTSVWLREQFMSGTEQSAASISATHICVTDWQTAGIARRGKTWQTKPGNITFSILSQTNKPAKELLGLSLVTGVGVANALSDFAGITVQLKWPNDVLFADVKLGGLLTELNTVPLNGNESGATQVLTGIGINFLHDQDVLDLGIGATSLQAVGLQINPEQRDRLIGKLAVEVLRAHQRFYEGGWGLFTDRWQSLDWLYNKNVIIHSQQSTEQAVARGVNEQGALLVERDGNIYPVYGGDVSVRPTV